MFKDKGKPKRGIIWRIPLTSLICHTGRANWLTSLLKSRSGAINTYTLSLSLSLTHTQSIRIHTHTHTHTFTHTQHKPLTARSQATLLPKRGACSRAICVHPASFPTSARTGVCKIHPSHNNNTGYFQHPHLGWSPRCLQQALVGGGGGAGHSKVRTHLYNYTISHAVQTLFKSFSSKPHIHANHKTGKLCCINNHWGKTSLMNVIHNQCRSWKKKKGEGKFICCAFSYCFSAVYVIKIMMCSYEKKSQKIIHLHTSTLPVSCM